MCRLQQNGLHGDLGNSNGKEWLTGSEKKVQGAKRGLPDGLHSRGVGRKEQESVKNEPEVLKQGGCEKCGITNRNEEKQNAEQGTESMALVYERMLGESSRNIPKAVIQGTMVKARMKDLGVINTRKS